ncbi:MAG: L-seryl-tRNA(Sec) selenium transferase, partial [uncultured Gemmatimonadaceae bacterium]
MPRSIAVEAARASLEARRAELVASADGEADGVATSPHSEPSAAARDAGAAPRGSRDGPASDASLESEARARAREAALPSLRAVLNATGVIVHTNLGRAPLAGAAVEAAAAVGRGYSTLEYDVASGARGSRQTHVESLVRELTGAEAALVVNNCAAAALLAATALAAGREIVVSRGQLVEIGGSFRVPDVVASSGARLVEVGTTNRTRFSDYERAVGPETGALMRVHPSNFRTVGFVEEVGIEELCELGRRSGVPVIDDAGSGALARGVEALGDEPDVRRSVAAGSAVVCFSGDKLLGGPQAGVMAGTSAAIERCRTHPLARALRIDKLSLAALEATLRLLR